MSILQWRGEPRRRRLPATAALAALVAVVGACSSPTEVVVPPVEALVASGDSQYGTAGQTLSAPLQVLIRSVNTKLPRSGVTVRWTVREGDASIVGVSATVTDSTGSARASLRMGQQTGPVTVRATVQERNEAFTDFHLFLVNRPVVTEVAPTSAAPGGSVTLTGQNFSPDPDQNVVLFSGIRGRVTAATATQLTVQVPACLPARPVAVTAQLGSVASESAAALTVEAGGTVTALQPGEVVDVVDERAFDCVTLPGDGSARYLVLAQSASALGAALHPFTLYGLAASGSPATFVDAAGQPALDLQGAYAVGQQAGQEDRGGHPQIVFDQRLRELEAELTKGRPTTAPDGSPTPPAAGPAGVEGPASVPPAVGERRSFRVYQGPGDFTTVDAVARYVGDRAALFVDEDAPSGGLDEQDLALFSARFDDFIHPSVTSSFGSESDLDDNDRVIILLSPAVNALTPRGSTGFVGGFFFGVDLLSEAEGSNQGEIFYTLVPDPDGIYSDPRSREDILEVVPAILAHEFQHMVHFNQRVLILDAEANEAVWLSEGLAQYAEELVARAYQDQGDSEGVALFRGGIIDRSRRYLSQPQAVSVVVSVGQGTLAERGGGYLHVAYLADRFGEDIVGALARTTRTGVTNVEAESGTDWPLLLSDWWAATWLDGPGVETGPLTYPTIDLRGFVGDPFPLEPEEPGPGDFTRSGSLPSSAVAYYLVTPATGGSTTLRLAGSGGGESAPQAGLQLRIVRVE